MNKSSRSGKERRPISSRPSAPRSSGPRLSGMNPHRTSGKESFSSRSSGKETFRPSFGAGKESAPVSKEFGGGKEFFGNNPGLRMPRRNRLFSLAGPIIIFLCCAMGACAALLYLVSQGILQLPGG